MWQLNVVIFASSAMAKYGTVGTCVVMAFITKETSVINIYECMNLQKLLPSSLEEKSCLLVVKLDYCMGKGGRVSVLCAN